MVNAWELPTTTPASHPRVTTAPSWPPPVDHLSVQPGKLFPLAQRRRPARLERSRFAAYALSVVKFGVAAALRTPRTVTLDIRRADARNMARIGRGRVRSWRFRALAQCSRHSPPIGPQGERQPLHQRQLGPPRASLDCRYPLAVLFTVRSTRAQSTKKASRYHNGISLGDVAGPRRGIVPRFDNDGCITFRPIEPQHPPHARAEEALNQATGWH